MDKDGNLRRDNTLSSRVKARGAKALDPNAILVQHQAGSSARIRSKKGSLGQASQASVSAEMPLDVIGYSGEGPSITKVASLASTVSSDLEADRAVKIRVTRKRQPVPRKPPQNLLAATNERVMDFKKVNMRKRILDEESRRACGDEDKLFNAR